MQYIKYTAIVFFLLCSSLYGKDRELIVRVETGEQIRTLFDANKFDEIDRLAKIYRESHERTPSGVWKLGILYEYLRVNSTNNNSNEMVEKESALERWIKGYPDSPTARLAKAQYLESKAWNIRGTSLAKNVPQEAWEPFHNQLDIAFNYMLSIKNIADSDPHWYALMVSILRGQNVDDHEYFKYINEGLDKHPGYYPIYFQTAITLLPKWGGDYVKLDKFARQATNYLGNEIYARLYWSASHQMEFNMFVKSRVSWDKMKLGMEEVNAKYPSEWNLQAYTYFACMSNDQKTTIQLFKKISKPIIVSVWGNKNYYQYCSNYGSGKTLEELLKERGLL